MPEKNKKQLERFGHGATAFTVNSDCVEVILFGGMKDLLESPIADTVVLRFGKCSNVMISEYIYYLLSRFTVLLMVMYLLHDMPSDYVYSVNWYYLI